MVACIGNPSIPIRSWESKDEESLRAPVSASLAYTVTATNNESLSEIKWKERMAQKLSSDIYVHAVVWAHPYLHTHMHTHPTGT